jgi:N utilization substance protein B
MALAEFIYFQEIPEKVTINEIIEISKNYSTDKSNIFINGLLDNFRKKLKEQGKIKKTGKGLIEK